MSSGSMQIGPGSVIDGRYEIVAPIGGGGYGMVYRAKQLNMDRDVALKVIHPHLAHDERLVKRFLREARAVSRLKNPHIVQVFDFGQVPDGPLFLVMELIEGQTLKAILATEGVLPPQRLCRLLSQLCEALAEAHSFPIVHRDIKPENILVSKTRTGSEHCYLVDFGIVRMEEEEAEVDLSLTGGLAIGTPHYMSPEQAFGDKPTHKADLWALGVLLFQGLSGKFPFVGNSAHMIVASVTRDAPQPLQPAPGQPPFPVELVALTTALLQKSPDERPADAQAVQQILLAVMGASSQVPGMTPYQGMTPHPGMTPAAMVATGRLASASLPALEIEEELGRTLPFGPATRPGSGRRLKIGLAVGAIAVVGVAVFVLVGGSGEAPAKAPPVTAVVAALAPAPPPSEQPAAAAPVAAPAPATLPATAADAGAAAQPPVAPPAEAPAARVAPPSAAPEPAAPVHAPPKSRAAPRKPAAGVKLKLD